MIELYTNIVGQTIKTNQKEKDTESLENKGMQIGNYYSEPVVSIHRHCRFCDFCYLKFSEIRLLDPVLKPVLDLT